MFGCQRVTRCLIGLTSTFYTSPSILSSLSEFVNKKETIRSKDKDKNTPRFQAQYSKVCTCSTAKCSLSLTTPFLQPRKTNRILQTFAGQALVAHKMPPFIPKLREGQKGILVVLLDDLLPKLGGICFNRSTRKAVLVEPLSVQERVESLQQWLCDRVKDWLVGSASSHENGGGQGVEMWTGSTSVQARVTNTVSFKRPKVANLSAEPAAHPSFVTRPNHVVPFVHA